MACLIQLQCSHLLFDIFGSVRIKPFTSIWSSCKENCWLALNYCHFSVATFAHPANIGTLIQIIKIKIRRRHFSLLTVVHETEAFKCVTVWNPSVEGLPWSVSELIHVCPNENKLFCKSGRKHQLFFLHFVQSPTRNKPILKALRESSQVWGFTQG